jgi:phosphatidylinositol-3-phosphatase
VVIVTADEDDSSQGNKVLTVVMHAGDPHRVVTTHLTHYSWTRYMAQITGTTALLAGANAPDMQAAFGL